MREQKPLGTPEKRPAATLTGRGTAQWPDCLASALGAAATHSYSLDLVLRNVSLMLQVSSAGSASKAARPRQGRSYS